MKKIRSGMHWVGLLLLMGLLTACLARLQAIGRPEKQGVIQVLASAPTETVAIDSPTPDAYALTLTALPTFPPTPEPTFYTPNPLNAAGTPKTATPMPATLMPGQTPATMPPPPTIQVGKTVDLSHGTPGPAMIISVRRKDGKYDIYRIPPQLLEGFNGKDLNQRFDQLMEINPGDEILGWQSEGNNGPASSPSVTETVAP